MKVECEIEEADIDGDYGTVSGIRATCTRCGHETESGGSEESSILRCLVLMREECPKGESNFYSEEPPCF